MASRAAGLVSELRRRKVFHVAGAYAVIGFGVIEAADLLFPRLSLPDVAVNFVVGAVLVGFPIALVLAWAYEVRPEALPEDRAEPEPAPEAGPRPGESGPVRSIVVLPFESLSADPEQEFFAAGMHDALITELAQIRSIRVISRTSALAFKGRSLPVPEIARALGVDGVLEASVLKVGERARIQAQLIGVYPEEHHIWAQAFDRDLTDVLAMHSEIVRAVAESVQVELTQHEEELLRTTRKVSPEAYELYLKGMFHLRKFTPEGFETGLRLLNQAVETEPTEPLPYAGLGLAWAIIGHTPNAPPDALPRARAAALEALELDDSVGEAHAALAQALIYHDWDVDGAGREYREALDLNPDMADIRAHYSFYLAIDGTWDEAAEEIERAGRQDPLNPAIPAWSAWLRFWAGRPGEALAEAEKALELFPDFPIANYAKGMALTMLGRFDEAIVAHQRAGAASPMFGWGLGCTFAAMGQDEKALEVARNLEANLTGWDSWCIAEIHAFRGDGEETIRWLERAVEMRHSYVPWVHRVPCFEFVRDDPRVRAVADAANAAG